MSAPEIKNTERGRGLGMRPTELLIGHLGGYRYSMVYDSQTRDKCNLDA